MEENKDSFKISKDDSIIVIVIAIPDNTMTYLTQITPFHKKYIPPKVKRIEKNGSIINIVLILLFIEVKESITPNNKNTTDKDKM